MMVPANGAATLAKLFNSSSRRTFARAALDGGGLEREVGLFLGGFLFAHAGGLEQLTPACGGGFGQCQPGFRLGQLRAGAGEFLVELRRVRCR